MKKHYSLIICIAVSLQGYAQYRLDAGIKCGASNYLGDIGGNSGTRHDFVSDLKINETKFSTGAFIRYRLLSNVSVSASYNYGQIAGDDALSSNPARRARNLSFRNNIHELNLEGQYFFYTNNDLFHTYHFANNFRMYLGAGLAVFHHNPQALYKGNWTDLRPLRTEGEVQPYSSYCMALPLTTGFYFTFNKVYRIGWEIGWRKTFTDYLDDVSGRYASPASLPNAMAVALANRTNQSGSDARFASNFSPGNKRGDPTHNDAYIFTTVNFSYVIKGRSVYNSRLTWVHYLNKHRKTRYFRQKF